MVPTNSGQCSDGAAAPALSIGAVFGGTHKVDRFWDRPITDLQRAVARAREGTTSPLRVNVVYHIEGRYTPNGFTGVRTGRFTRAGPILMIQAAVPSDDIENPDAVLLGLLNEAIESAEQYAKKNGIATQLTAIRGISDRIAL